MSMSDSTRTIGVAWVLPGLHENVQHRILSFTRLQLPFSKRVVILNAVLLAVRIKQVKCGLGSVARCNLHLQTRLSVLRAQAERKSGKQRNGMCELYLDSHRVAWCARGLLLPTESLVHGDWSESTRAFSRDKDHARAHHSNVSIVDVLRCVVYFMWVPASAAVETT